MKRLAVVFLVVCLVESVSYCTEQLPDAGKAITVKKGDVLLEVQQLPLSAFGAPAEIEKPDRWSAWLVRITNRRKWPIMLVTDAQTPDTSGPGVSVVGGPGFPPPLGGGSPRVAPSADGGATGPTYTHDNWALVDGEDKRVGAVVHRVDVQGETPGVFARKPVFDYLITGEKSKLADAENALHAPPRRLSQYDADLLPVLFRYGARAADLMLKQRRQSPGALGPGIIGYTEPERPCNALWPGENAWGYLVFYRGIQTRSKAVVPEARFGAGVTWARVVNPELANELTRPQEPGEDEPSQEDRLQRWLREQGYTTEDGEK